MRIHQVKGRKVNTFVTVVRVTINYHRVVIEDLTRENCLLVSKELRVLRQPRVHIILVLAPVVVFRCVLAVSEHDCRDVVLGHEIVVFHRDTITVLKAQWLIVPRERVLWHEALFMIFAAFYQLVRVPHL